MVAISHAARQGLNRDALEEFRPCDPTLRAHLTCRIAAPVKWKPVERGVRSGVFTMRRPASGLDMAENSLDLFENVPSFPPGFRYQPELISGAEERRLVQEMEKLHFKPFEFQGFTGKRLIVSFGWRYDFSGGGLQKTDDMPHFLLAVRKQAAAFADMDPARLRQVLLTQYPPGAAIGWHKDRSVFGQVIGISLLSACTFRFRKQNGKKWARSSFIAEPRSCYLLDGPARTAWEHSIPAVQTLRYSITFRNLREG